MKKIILTLLITLLSLVTFAQEPLFGRAYEFHLGEVITDEIHWIQKPTPVDIVIQLNDGEIIIYSEEHQVYQIVREMGRQNDTVMWKAIDKRGNYCWVFLTVLDDISAALTIRYDDYAWMYICREQ